MSQYQAVAEKILKVPLLEVQTIRLICKGTDCGKVIELPISSAKGPEITNRCKFCGQSWVADASDSSAIYQLARAYGLLSLVADRVAVELVVPVEEA